MPATARGTRWRSGWVATRGMPIHADPEVARAAGFERPISHRLNALGLAGLAIVNTCAPGCPGQLQALAARFVQPGLRGDTVRVEVFGELAGAIRVRARAVERGVQLIDRGTCELAA